MGDLATSLPHEPTLLIVDDSEIIRRALASLLRKGQFSSILTASSGDEAWARLQGEGGVDLVVADILMPGMTGIDLCRQIKGDPTLRTIPVIMITAQDDESALEAAFEAGANDFIGKPPRPFELWARIRSALALKAEMDRRQQREAELVQSQAELETANRRLERLSMQDGLTGIANRRMLDQTLVSEWSRAARNRSPLSLLLIDIDHFKAYNDHYGHQEGDLCLKACAAAVELALKRAADLVARYGGEEFAVLLPDTDADGATEVAERLRATILLLELRHEASPVAKVVTASIGVATMHPSGKSTADALLAAADAALYEAKGAGRNRVARHRPAAAKSPKA